MSNRDYESDRDSAVLDDKSTVIKYAQDLENLSKREKAAIWIEPELTSLCTKLNSTNYFRWKKDLTVLLQCKGLSKHIDGSTTRPDDPEELTKWVQKDNQALGYILMSLNDEYHRLVINHDTAKETWDALINHQKKTSVINAHLIQQKYYRFKFNNSHTVTSYLAELETILSELESGEVIIPEVFVILKILDDLPAEFSLFIQLYNLKVASGINYTLAQIKDLLLITEQSVRPTHDNKHGEALALRHNKFKARKDLICNFCRKPGHVRSNCFKLRRRKQTNSN